MNEAGASRLASRSLFVAVMLVGQANAQHASHGTALCVSGEEIARGVQQVGGGDVRAIAREVDGQ